MLLKGMAQRGRLTSRVLDILLRNRRNLRKLPLYSLMTVNEETIIERLKEQKRLDSIDISFSRCLGNLRVPFFENVVETPSRDSLTYLAANHVKGAIGLRVLHRFSNLKHLDVSFTDLEEEQFRAAMTSLRHLRHLNVSGTSLTWYEVFSTAKDFASDQLEELFMHSLEIMSDGDWKAGKGSQSTVDCFFGKLQRLLSLDISCANAFPGIKMSNHSICDKRFLVTLYRILRCASSLTHLDVSNNCEWDILEKLLVKADRLSQMRFLGNAYLYCQHRVLPETLTSRPNLKLFAAYYVPDVTCSEYHFHQCHVLKDVAYFSSTLYEVFDVDGALLKAKYERFIGNGLVPLMLMMSTAARRCRTDDFHFYESFLVVLLGLFESVPAVVFTNSPFTCDSLEQILESVLLFNLRHKNKRPEFFDDRADVMSLLAIFPTFVASRNALRNLALQFSLHVTPEESEAEIVCTSCKWVFLASVIATFSQQKRKQLTSKIGSQMTSNLAAIISISEKIATSHGGNDPVDYWLRNVFENGKALLNSFVLLFGGLPTPDVVFAFDGTLPVEAIATLAQMAMESFSTHADERRSALYVASLEALAVIAECPHLALSLFSKRFFDAVVIRAPRDTSMHMAHSYLACLLLVHDQSSHLWPSDCEARERLAASILLGDLSDVNFTYHQATILPLLTIARSTEFPSVTAFGLQRLAFFCSSHFDAEAYHSRYWGLCPVCMIRKEVGFCALSSIPVPSILQSSLKFDPNCVAQKCKNLCL